MDQQNYFYGKHNIGSLNYQPVFANSSSEYQATGFSEPLHHTTGLNFNSSSSTANSTCSNLSNTSSTGNLSRSSNNNVSANPTANEYNPVSYSRFYSYLPENTVQNASTSTSSNTSDCNNITYGSAFNSKSYENTTNSAHAPVIAVTSNSSHPRGYHSNISYGSYQNADYSLHKSLNQNYPASSIMPPSSSTQNRSTLNSTTAFTAMDHIVQPSVKSRTNSNADGKMSAKTSVIKPLNAYNSSASAAGNVPLNYTKYVPSYPLFTNNNKTVPALEKSPSTVNRGMYLNSSANHKNSDIYCPEPIPARYSNPSYAINVTTPGTGHTNSHYLTANSYPLNYGHHHLTQHQSSVSHHARNLLPASAYQASLDESASPNYYNRQNGIVVRPTPNTYKQGQLTYQSAYNYGRSNIANSACGISANHTSNSHSTLPKPQSQKPIDDSYNSLALDFDSSYDRRNFRQYSSVYGTNYIDSASYEGYSQYPGYASANTSSVPFYSGKTPSKLLYNYNAGLYNSNAAHVQLPSQTPQSIATSSSSLPTSSTTTIVQQPVPINPSSSQQISSNYDTTSLHTHPILPPSLFNNNSKEFCTPNQYQQNPYASQILYSTLQNGSYYSSVKPNQSTLLPSNTNEAHSLQNKVYSEKSLPTQTSKYTVIDLEEQINSSKIPKVSGSVLPNSKLNQRMNDGNKMPVISLQEHQWQHKHVSSQNLNESNRSVYAYNDGAYSNSYQAHQYQHQWRRTLHPSSVASSSTTTHLHPKKQSIRDFLSTWNEDEEEDVDTMSKKAASNNSQHNSRGTSHIESRKCVRLERSSRINENVPVIVQPIVQPVMQPTPQVQASHLQSVLTTQPSYQNLPFPSVPLISPKIHVGIAVDNGSQNLPDIIIDIEKTKGNGEGECFERTNGKCVVVKCLCSNTYYINLLLFSIFVVIQEVPKASEKLYILDSIDVPLSDLSKYRHLSVVNKLPENIVLPPPPPLRHENSEPDEPTKSVEENNLSHTELTKDDFEMNVHDDDKDLVETKNFSIVQNVKKLLKKYRKHDQMRNKKKGGAFQHGMPNDHNTDLSTPLRSLSPAHDFDEMTSAVDLTVNNKEINEFIDNLCTDNSICSDGSASDYDLIASPLAEILQLTEPQPNMNLVDDKSDDDLPKKQNENQHDFIDVCDRINEDEKSNEQTEIEATTKTNEDKASTPDIMVEVPVEEKNASGTTIDSLQNYCIRAFNTKEFREYYKENIINRRTDEEELPDKKDSSENITSIVEILDTDSDDSSAVSIIQEHFEEKEMDEDEEKYTKVQSIAPASIHNVPSLRELAMQAVRLNQCYMSSNLKPLKIVFEFESQRKVAAMDASYEICTNKVPTLQELAREVANTIYSFNVKPLQDICRLAIEKFNQLYLVSRIDAPNANIISELAAAQNQSDLCKGLFLLK